MEIIKEVLQEILSDVSVFKWADTIRYYHSTDNADGLVDTWKLLESQKERVTQLQSEVWKMLPLLVRNEIASLIGEEVFELGAHRVIIQDPFRSVYHYATVLKGTAGIYVTDCGLNAVNGWKHDGEIPEDWDRDTMRTVGEQKSDWSHVNCLDCVSARAESEERD